jgi:hypothetical protein
MFPDIDEHLVGELLGDPLIAHDPRNEAENAVLVPHIERLEGNRIRGGNPRDELIVCNKPVHSSSL